MWHGKKVLIGISGGIAAYKIPSLIRLLTKKGAEVKVVATSSALEFVTPLVLQTLSHHPVYTQLFTPANEFSTEHIALTDWADMMIVAPATANIIGKLANGIADDALSTTLLAFNHDVFIAPAMNCKMYEHPSVQKNLNFLAENNYHLINPPVGDLACGYTGRGRMEEPERIKLFIESFYAVSQDLLGKKILVTAGPTYEKIDAVRFIGNYSSGLMGYSLAEELASRGAEVTLISGPTHLKTRHSNIQTIAVESAAEMYTACHRVFPTADAAILAAAVADFTPEKVAEKKIKKQDASLNIKLALTQDILKSLGEIKKKGQTLVGFALETDHEIENAKSKLESKNLDFIVLNSLKIKGAGFKTSTNQICILDKSGKIFDYEMKPKTEVAKDITNFLTQKMRTQKK